MKKKDFKAFQSNFLGKDDLSGPRVVTIKDVTEEEIQGEGGKDTKPVMHFRDHEKAFILNNINWDTIADVFGDESDDWRGKQIELYVDPSIMFGSKRVGGVRVRLPISSPTANGNGEVWNWAQAQGNASAAGITDLPALLKARGLAGYNAQRDTATVKAIIQERKVKAPFGDEQHFTEDDIPFDQAPVATPAQTPAAGEPASSEPVQKPMVPLDIAAEVKSWVRFEELFNEAAQLIGWTPTETAQALHKRLSNIGRVGKGETTTVEWRIGTLTAMTEDRIDKETGKTLNAPVSHAA